MKKGIVSKVKESHGITTEELLLKQIKEEA